MPMRVRAAAAVKAASPRIPAELLDQLVTGPMTQEEIEEVMRGFKKALIERYASLLKHPPVPDRPEASSRPCFDSA